MMNSPKKTAVLVHVFLLLSAPAFGSGGGIAPVGPTITGGSTDTGLREIIELRNLGNGLFAGRPHNPLVPLITVLAPGGSHGWVILRELVTPGGQRHLLLTAPSAFHRKILRATLYLATLGPEPTLFESVGDRWRLRGAERITVDGTKVAEGANGLLLAFRTSGLGHYRVVPEPDGKPPIVSAIPDEEATPNILLGGSTLHGFKSWIAALALLLVTVIFSRVLHVRENTRDD